MKEWQSALDELDQVDQLPAKAKQDPEYKKTAQQLRKTIEKKVK